MILKKTNNMFRELKEIPKKQRLKLNSENEIFRRKDIELIFQKTNQTSNLKYWNLITF
jgi:hypothetical protein